MNKQLLLNKNENQYQKMHAYEGKLYNFEDWSKIEEVDYSLKQALLKKKILKL